MRDTDHAAQAELWLKTSHNHTDSNDPGDERIASHTAAQAQAHALLALLPLVREIGDQLDTIPRRRRGGNPQRFPLHDAAEILEAYAIGDEGSAREETIARLVMHHRFPYKDATQIAEAALGADLPDTWRMTEIADAIKTLGIEMP